MGKTREKVIVKNIFDIENAANGIIKPENIRSAEITGLVDTGAAYLSLPPRVIKLLGLPYAFSKPIRTGNGSLELRIFRGAEIIIQDRSVEMQVMENKDDSIPTLIGYMVLEEMDLVVHPKKEIIIGNPENDGKWIIDMY